MGGGSWGFSRKSSTRPSAFFFQAEDGIRYLYVTGVQTCALPISDRRVALGGRDEDRPPGCGARAVVRVVVAIAEEQAVVEVGGVLRDVIDERGARRPFRVQPVELVADRVPLVEHAIRSLREHARIALVLHAKPPNRHTVHLLDARRELVAPRHVIARTRGEDFDLRVPRQMFGDVPRMELGAAVHRLPVALDDDGDLHCGSGSPLRSGAGAGGGSAPEDSRRVSAASAAGAGAAPPSSPPSYSSTASASDTEIASPAIVPAVSDVLCAAGAPMIAAADPAPRRPRRRRRRRLRCPGPSTPVGDPPAGAGCGVSALSAAGATYDTCGGAWPRSCGCGCDCGGGGCCRGGRSLSAPLGL